MTTVLMTSGLVRSGSAENKKARPVGMEVMGEKPVNVKITHWNDGIHMYVLCIFRDTTHAYVLKSHSNFLFEQI